MAQLDIVSVAMRKSDIKVWIYESLLISVEEVQLFRELIRNKLFMIGLFSRILMVLFSFPLNIKAWFLPVIVGGINAATLNPWEAHMVNGGDVMSFPYGVAMYLVYLPLTFAGNYFDKIVNVSFFAKIGFLSTSLLFDFLLLSTLSFISKDYSPKRMLILYWLSPIVLYVTYWHGQLDVIPVSLLCFSLFFLQRQRGMGAGILFAISVSSKFSMIIALPFILIFTINNSLYRVRVKEFLLAFSCVLSALCLPFFFSSGYLKMVFGTQETLRILGLRFDYGDNLIFLLTPFTYLLAVYLFARLGRITFDLFFASVGIGFLSLLVCIHPAPGWYLWVLPFMVFSQVKWRHSSLATSLFFSISYMLYFLFFNSEPHFQNMEYLFEGSELTYFGRKVGFAPFYKSLSFTLLQATSLLIWFKMYEYGISKNNYYRWGKRPFVLGVVGNSGRSRSLVCQSLLSIFSINNVSYLGEEYYAKCDRSPPIRESCKLNASLLYNLNSLVRDVESLVGMISINTTYSGEGDIGFLGVASIKPTNLVLLSGAHIMKMRRLRDYIDLAVYIDIDPSVLDGFDCKSVSSLDNNLSGLSVSETQASLGDVSSVGSLKFWLRRVGAGYPLVDRAPRLKLIVETLNGLYHEKLVHSLIAICGMHIDTEYSSSLDQVYLSIEGDASSEDLQEVARILIPNIDDLMLAVPKWRDNSFGLIQLITLLHMSEVLSQSTR